jgi:fucose 4-O-acetylase-like acetyltransferase
MKQQAASSKQQAASSKQQAASSKQPHRILWIDFAKVVGIWLVVLGHMEIPTSFTNIIYSFHMPLFFFLSGYLEKDRTIKDNLINSLRTLLIPYVLLYLIKYLCWFPVNLLQNPNFFGQISIDNALIKPILGMIFGVGYDTSFSTMVAVTLWFMVGLFFVKIINSVFLLMNRRNILFYILFNLIIISIVLMINYFNVDILFSIDSAFLAFPFFSIGNILRKRNGLKILETIHKKYLLAILAFVGYILLVIIVPFNGYVNVNRCNYGKSIILFYFIGIIGIGSTIFLSLLYTNRSKIITVIATGTIIIMAFHGIVREIIFRIIGLSDVDVIINPLSGIIISGINTIIFIFPIVIIKKYFPILIGGRK